MPPAMRRMSPRYPWALRICAAWPQRTPAAQCSTSWVPGLGAALAFKRRELKQALAGGSLPTALSEAWSREWSATRSQGEDNQAFLRHSVRNMNLLMENMKRLLGDAPLYGAKGTSTQASASGKVVEAKY